MSTVVNRAAQVIREKAPPLWVRGEVSGWKRSRNGHCYFTLKDDRAELCCTVWDRTARLLPALPSDGMEVDVFGQLTIYPRRGQFQMEVLEVASRGIGGLWQVARERLVAQLRSEGLLDEDRKRPLPEFPERVGIVTSAQSAVLHDMHRTLRRKAWWVPVVVSHSGVEGAGAAEEVAAAIRRFGSSRETCPVDVVIVARGGGSMESLWGFNLEPVARAIAGCPVPVISAVGHETDFTVADLVADYRAATPTAGAERAVPDGRQVAARLQAWPGELRRRVWSVAGRRGAEAENLEESIRTAAAGRLRYREMQLGAAERHLAARSPRQAWLRASERIDGSVRTLRAGIEKQVANAERNTEAAASRLATRAPGPSADRAAERLGRLGAALEERMVRRLRAAEQSVAELRPSLDRSVETRLAAIEQEFAAGLDALDARSPLRVLARGYAVVTEPGSDRPIRSVRDVHPEARLRIRLADGDLAVRVLPDTPASTNPPN